jgi:hypothetical protein
MSKPFKLTSKLKKQALKNSKVNKKFVDNYRPAERYEKKLDRMVDDSLSHSFLPSKNRTIDSSDFSTSTIPTFPAHGLLNFNDV